MEEKTARSRSGPGDARKFGRRAPRPRGRVLGDPVPVAEILAATRPKIFQFSRAAVITALITRLRVFFYGSDPPAGHRSLHRTAVTFIVYLPLGVGRSILLVLVRSRRPRSRRNFQFPFFFLVSLFPLTATLQNGTQRCRCPKTGEYRVFVWLLRALAIERPTWHRPTIRRPIASSTVAATASTVSSGHLLQAHRPDFHFCFSPDQTHDGLHRTRSQREG